MKQQQQVLRFVRHGATTANTAGLRCGGDLDLPMSSLGHQQAQRVADTVARLDPPIGLIVTSDLRRTRETAAAIARRVPAAQIVVDPAFAERRLGSWNLLPISDSQRWLDAGETPPGGESDKDFVARIERAVQSLSSELPRRPLLVASKGVARVLGRMTGHGERLEPANGEVLEFHLSAPECAATTGGEL